MPIPPPARVAAALLALCLLSTACGDSGEATTTTAPRDGTSIVPPPDTSPATTVAAPTTTHPPTTTTQPPTTTTTPPTTSSTTTQPPTTTTTSGGEPGAAGVAEAKAEALLAAVPEGWKGTLVADTGTGDAIVFSPCLDEDDFDLDNLDAFSLATSEVDVEGPPGSGVLGPANATIEARVFQSREIAGDAFAVLQKVLGTPEGRDCLAATVSEAIENEGTDGVTFAVEVIDIAGAEVAVRFTLALADFSILIDIAATLIDDCTVYAVFIGVGESFPAEVADILFAAAAA